MSGSEGELQSFSLTPRPHLLRQPRGPDTILKATVAGEDTSGCSVGAQVDPSSDSTGQPALMTIGPIKCPFKKDFCRCVMKINAFLPGRAVRVINEVMEGPLGPEARCYLCTSKNMFSHFLNDEDIEPGY